MSPDDKLLKELLSNGPLKPQGRGTPDQKPSSTSDNITLLGLLNEKPQKEPNADLVNRLIRSSASSAGPPELKRRNSEEDGPNAKMAPTLAHMLSQPPISRHNPPPCARLWAETPQAKLARQVAAKQERGRHHSAAGPSPVPQMVVSPPPQMVVSPPPQIVVSPPPQQVVSTPLQMVARNPQQMAQRPTPQMVARGPQQLVQRPPHHQAAHLPPQQLADNHQAHQGLDMAELPSDISMLLDPVLSQIAGDPILSMIVDQAMKQQQQQVFPGEMSNIPSNMMALPRPPNPRLQGPHQGSQEDTRSQKIPDNFRTHPTIGSVPDRPPRNRPSSIPGIRSQGPPGRNPVIQRVPVQPSASAPQSYGPVSLQARTQPPPRAAAEVVARSNHPTIVPIGASGAPAGVTLSPEDLQEIGFFLSDLPSGGQPGGQDTLHHLVVVQQQEASRFPPTPQPHRHTSGPGQGQEDSRQGGRRQEDVKTESVEQMILSQEPARNPGPPHQILQIKPGEGTFVFNQQHEGDESLLLN